MTDQTPGTSPDPELGSEGDENQLPKEDTLINRGVDDVLDEGYTPPDQPRPNHFGETEREELQGESLDQRLAQERPEVWQETPAGAGQTDGVGRLEEGSDAGTGKDNDVLAVDTGVAGGDATAEEAAMRVVDEDQQS